MEGIEHMNVDLPLALWQINPAAEYLLNDAHDQIVEWRGPGEQPTQEELEAAWVAYLASDAPAQHGFDQERHDQQTKLRQG